MLSLLYVDDESGLLELGQVYLEGKGEFKVTTALSAGEGLKLLAMKDFDAIISDYMMPEMNGLEFLKAVRKSFGTIPFILFTGKGREEVVVEAINNGVDFYLQKGGAPKAQFAELAHKVRQAVTRRRAEERIQSSLFFLNALIDQSPYPIWISDEKGSLIRMNAACERLLHTSEAELAGKYNVLKDNIVEEQGFIPLVRSVFEEGRIVSFTLNYESARLASLSLKESVNLVLEVTIFPIKNAAGMTTNAVVIHNDITERKRAEAALADSERKYRTVFEAAEEGIWIVDPEFRTLSVNRKMQEIFGYTEHEMMGRPVWAFVLPDEAESMKQELSKRPKGESGRYERRWVRKDGTVIWCLTSGAPLFGPDQKFLGSFGMFTDITERKQAESALRESEAKQRAVIDQSFGFIGLLDTDGRLIAANRSSLEFAGVSESDVLNRPFWETRWWTYSPELRESLSNAIRRAVAGETVRFEATHQAADGHLAFFDFSLKPVQDAEGRALYLIAEGRDITDRKRTEDALRASERRFHDLIELLPLGVYEADVSGRLTYANRYAREMFGHTEEEVRKGLNAVDIFVPKDRERAAQNFRRVAEEMAYANSTVEYQAVRKDGSVFPIAIYSLPIIENGRTVGIRGILMDITEQKNAEEKKNAAYEQLKKSEDELRLLKISADRSSDEVFWLDFAGNILYVNDSACRITGYSRDEFMKMKIFELDPDFPPEIWDASVADLRRRKTQFITTKHRCKDGRIIDVDIVTVYVNQDDREYSFAYVREITERKRMQDALRESEEKYRTLVESSFDGIAIHQDGLIVYVNRTAARLLGADDPAVFIGRPAIDIVSPEYHERIRRRIEEAPIGSQGLIQEKFVRVDGTLIDVDVTTTPTTWNGRTAGYVTFRDITAQVRAEEALEKRIIALTQPLDDTGVAFDDLFNIDELQRLQDEFAKATGVAMLLTRPDGTPITRPSNFCRLCSDIVRSTEEGRRRCQRSDSVLGELHEGGPFVHTCLSAGLWGAGASIVLGGRHIANWLIGQVRNETQTEEGLRTYARELGVDEDEFIRAFLEVPVMSTERFEAVAQSLFTLSNQLSAHAYQNMQQARFITERKRAEEALRESEEKYRALVETTSDFIWEVNANGAYTYVSPQVRQILGYEPEELVGRTPFDIMPPDEARRMAAEFSRHIARRVPITTLENKALKKDGSVVILETNGVARFAKDGSYQGYRGIDRDITKRKRAEEALREKTEEFNQFFTTSLDMFCIADTDGYFRRLNPQWEETLGYPLSELEGRRFLDLVHPDDRARTIEAMSKLEKQKSVLGFENRYRHKDGSYRWIEWRSMPVGSMVFAAARDITQRHMAVERAGRISALKQILLRAAPLEEKLKEITDGIVELFGADFARIWIVGAGDLCDKGCIHAGATHKEFACRDRTRCLHLIVSSGRYTHTDGGHRRVPFGAFKIGRIATGEERRFVTNEVTRDPRVHDHAWAKSLGLKSFAGFRLVSPEGNPIGVLAFFSRLPVLPEVMEDLADMAATTSQVIRTGMAEQALRESEARLSSILHGSPLLQFVIDRNHRVISWNRTLEEYSNIRAADIIGTDRQWSAFYPERRPVIADLLVDGDAEAIEHWYAGKLRKSRYVEGSYEATDFFPQMGGSGKWLLCTAAPVRDAQGEIIGAVETLEDVTERISAEAALRRSEEWARTILNTAQAGIIIVDAATHTIIDANEKALELINLPRESVTGSVCHRFICPAEEGRCPITDLGLAEDTSERVLLACDGAHIPVLKTVVPVTMGDRDILVESFVDISERKRSESAIREVNRKLNLLSSITRHDVANQLQVVRGYAQLANQEAPDPAIKDYLGKIESAVERIEHQIQFTKEYQELGVHEPAWFNVGEVIRGAQPAQVLLRCSCDAIEVFADPMIGRVFYNLFDNAMKHGEHVTAITAGCRTEGGELVIIFADDGVGIPPYEKEMIFEKGYGRNTGYGLFLTREILAITGMTINETGMHGEGAQFEITVPEGAFRIKE